MLILAGVSIGAVFGERGIFTKAEQATDKYEQEKAREALELRLSEIRMRKYESGLTEEQLEEELSKIGTLLPKEDENSDKQQVIVDGYIFEINKGTLKVEEELGKIDKLVPIIRKLDTIVTTNSFTAKATVYGLQEGKLTYYYRLKGSSNSYSEVKNGNANQTIDEVQGATVTGLTPGTVYEIKAVATNENGSDEKTTEVIITKILIENLSIDPTNCELPINGKKQITTVIGPENATNKNLKWTVTEGTGIVTVSETGEITAAREGVATINVTTLDGSNKTAICTVTVKGTPKAPSLSLSGTVGKNDWYRSDVSITVTPNPADTGKVQRITYTLEGAQTSEETETSSIVAVSAEGITTVKVYVYDSYGQKSGPATVTIRKDTIAPTINGLTDITGASVNDSVYTGITYSDTTSGIDNNTRSCTPANILTGTNEYTYTISDNAGNTTTGKRKIGTGIVCFVAGTKVSTPKGLVNIEDLKIGDTVYSYNEETGKVEEKEILETYVNNANVIETITFENGEKVESTEVHQYYVVGKGWIQAKDLVEGDKVLTQDKTICKVVRNQIKRTEIIKVYNFNVSDNHNYFVGTTMMLVHNTQCGS